MIVIKITQNTHITMRRSFNTGSVNKNIKINNHIFVALSNKAVIIYIFRCISQKEKHYLARTLK